MFWTSERQKQRRTWGIGERKDSATHGLNNRLHLGRIRLCKSHGHLMRRADIVDQHAKVEVLRQLLDLGESRRAGGRRSHVDGNGLGLDSVLGFFGQRGDV
jgi:hypothetical protein